MAGDPKVQEMYVLYVELKTIACVEAIAKDLAGLGDVHRVEEDVYKEQAGCAMFTCEQKVLSMALKHRVFMRRVGMTNS